MTAPFDRAWDEDPGSWPNESFLDDSVDFDASSFAARGEVDPAWFLDYLDGVLSLDEEAACDELLLADAELARRFDSYRRRVDLLRAVGAAERRVDGGATLRARILADARKQIPTKRLAHARLAWISSTFLAAASLAVFFSLDTRKSDVASPETQAKAPAEGAFGDELDVPVEDRDFEKRSRRADGSIAGGEGEQHPLKKASKVSAEDQDQEESEVVAGVSVEAERSKGDEALREASPKLLRLELEALDRAELQGPPKPDGSLFDTLRILRLANQHQDEAADSTAAPAPSSEAKDKASLSEEVGTPIDAPALGRRSVGKAVQADKHDGRDKHDEQMERQSGVPDAGEAKKRKAASDDALGPLVTRGLAGGGGPAGAPGGRSRGAGPTSPNAPTSPGPGGPTSPGPGGPAPGSKLGTAPSAGLGQEALGGPPDGKGWSGNSISMLPLVTGDPRRFDVFSIQVARAEVPLVLDILTKAGSQATELASGSTLLEFAAFEASEGARTQLGATLRTTNLEWPAAPPRAGDVLLAVAGERAALVRSAATLLAKSAWQPSEEVLLVRSPMPEEQADQARASQRSAVGPLRKEADPQPTAVTRERQATQKDASQEAVPSETAQLETGVRDGDERGFLARFSATATKPLPKRAFHDAIQDAVKAGRPSILVYIRVREDEGQAPVEAPAPVETQPSDLSDRAKTPPSQEPPQAPAKKQG